MLNLKRHKDLSTDFLDAVIKSKRNSTLDPTYKSRLQLLLAGMKNHFVGYDLSFDANALESLSAAGYTGQQKSDILSLYVYHSVIMQKLKKGVTTLELNRVVSTCQNCTIGEVNSFDHAVPQGEFPEFVVHPKNLFPSCTRCNGHKSNIWRNGGKRLFLNLYLDKLPELQYLFVTVDISGNKFDVQFSVSNPNAIDACLFNKIEYHYKNLLLCERFSENIDKVVTPLKHSIAASLGILTIDEAVDVAKKTADRNRAAFGFNYWKSILELELLSSNEFLQICMNL